MVPLVESRLACHIDPEVRPLLVDGAETRRLRTGDVLFEEGQAGDGLYVVESGAVEIAARSMPGRMHRLAVMEPGDYFGEMSVFDGGPRSATATALGDATVHFVDTPTIRRVLDHSPRLAAAMVRDASLRVRQFNRRFLLEVLKAERLSLVERLARTIVHDFRNPLNVIGLAADLAARPAAGPAERAHARDRIRKQVEVLNRMMQELLEFTRAMPPQRILGRQPYASFLAEALLELHPEATRRGVHLVVEQPLPEVEVRCDPPRLLRVLTNLLQNAFDALSDRPDGTVRVRFRSDGDVVETDVADNGPGVPAEVLPDVFQPFVTFGKAHGTGLGLAICERIVGEHGGHISVHNDPGGGAVFRFTLPIARPGDTDHTPAPGR